MLLQDEELISGVKHWITDRLYNAEWALTTQLEVLSRQFDDMEDDYLRERKADLEQVAERILRYMKGVGSPTAPPSSGKRKTQQDLLLDDSMDVPLVLIAHDLSPADMLQFKQSVFAGFVTDVGGRNSHTAIVARSMDIPAVVGTRSASHLVRQDDWIVIDGDAGVMIVDPSPIILAEYGFKQRQGELERGRLSRLRHTPAVTLDGQKVELLANIELPEDAPAAVKAGAVGVGLFRSEFLFMGRARQPAGRGGAVPGLPPRGGGHGRPAGHDSHRRRRRRQAAGRHRARRGPPESRRWACAPSAGAWPTRPCSCTQLRAILRAAAHGQVNLLIPMLAHASEIRQTLSLVDFARAELDNRGVAYGPVKLGAMIEIPAAALTLKIFLKYFDFLSIGTNDLIQYTLGDRPRRRVGGAPLRSAASRGSAPRRGDHRRMQCAGQGRQRVRRDGRRHQPHPPAAGPGPAQLLHASGADPCREAGGVARGRGAPCPLGAKDPRLRRSSLIDGQLDGLLRDAGSSPA